MIFRDGRARQPTCALGEQLCCNIGHLYKQRVAAYGFGDPFTGSAGWRERYGDGLLNQINSAEMIAAKWGIIGLMKTVAMELGPYGIRANAILPGSVNGPRIDRVFADEAAVKGMTPQAVRAGKRLSSEVAGQDLTPALRDHTARHIADIRASEEGRAGLHAFLKDKHAALLQKMEAGKALDKDKEAEAQLAAAIADFKKTGTY